MCVCVCTHFAINATVSSNTARANIALTTSDGRRIVNSYTLDTSLWIVLLISESSASVNLTGMFAANGDYLQPIVTYMTTAYRTLKALEETKLSALGLRNGQNCVLRLRHEAQQGFNKDDPNFISVLSALRQQIQVPPQQPTVGKTLSTITNVPDDALDDVQSLSSITTSQVATDSSGEGEEQLENENDDENMLKMDEISRDEPTEQQSEVSDAMEEDDPLADAVPSGLNRSAEAASSSESVQNASNGDKNNKEISSVKVFMLDTSSSSAMRFSARDFDSQLTDQDFQLTPSELKMLLKDADEKRKRSQMFISKDVTEREKRRMAAVYDKCVVRFRFPNSLIIQATFKPSHTIRDLRKFVRETIEDTENERGQRFMIYVSPPVQRIDTEQNLGKTLERMHFLPAVILNVGLDRKYYEWRAKESQKKGERYTVPGQLVIRDTIMQQAQVVGGVEAITEQTTLPKNLNTQAKQGTKRLTATDSTTTTHSPQGEKNKVPKWLKLNK